MNLIARSRGVWIAAATAVACSLVMTAPATAQEKSKTNLKVAIFSHIGEVQTISGMMKAAVEDAKARGWTVETFEGAAIWLRSTIKLIRSLAAASTP